MGGWVGGWVWVCGCVNIHINLISLNSHIKTLFNDINHCTAENLYALSGTQEHTKKQDSLVFFT